MLFVMLFTSKGAAGVAGAGFVALAATLPTLGILPAAGPTLLLGVERFMSEIRAVTNLFSNICDDGRLEMDGRTRKRPIDRCAGRQNRVCHLAKLM